MRSPDRIRELRHAKGLSAIELACRAKVSRTKLVGLERGITSRPHLATLVYDLLFKCAAETLQQIAADPKHLGAEIGFLAALHTRARTCNITHTSTALCRVAGRRPMAHVGSHANPASFYRPVYSAGSSGLVVSSAGDRT